MNKEMIISSSDHETRVAILEDDQVVEVFIERERQRGVVGNIYKGRVSKVLPGMQSSFVDIGLERDAFLYVSEVVNTVEEFERLESGTKRTASRRTRQRLSPSSSRRWIGPGGQRPARSPATARRRASQPRAGELSGPGRLRLTGAARRRQTATATGIAPSPKSKTC